MDGKGAMEAAERGVSASTDGTNAPRRRRNGNDRNLRYFLIKPGSSLAKPELGQEMSSEGEALIEAFRAGQPFYTVTIWKAVPEVNGASPVIVKQAIAPKKT
ncbi:MAG: hypothetical protein ACM3JB_22035 [Acidobacteriaceae bacterium]